MTGCQFHHKRTLRHRLQCQYATLLQSAYLHHSITKQAVVLKNNKPRPCVAHRCIARFLGIDQKMYSGYPMVTPLFLWKFHANRSSRLLLMLSNAGKDISIAASCGFSQNWPKIESGHPMVTPHLPWKIHADQSSRFLVILQTKKQRYKQRKI